MPPADYISMEELKNSSHKEFNDSALMDLASTVLDVSAYQLLRSAMLHCNERVYETHLDAAFRELMMGPGRIAPRYRQYIIDVLVGDAIFIVDADAERKQAILMA